MDGSNTIHKLEQEVEVLKQKLKLLESRNNVLKNELLYATEKAEGYNNLKSAFLANISHEIRTPMNGILGFSEILMLPDIPKNKQNKYACLIKSGCMQLLTIVNDIVDISQIQTGQISIALSEVNINKIISDIFISFESIANNKNINFNKIKGLADDQARIITDKEMLRKILSKLINNAIKFTDKGCIEFGYHPKNNNIEFYVRDTGIGINPGLHSIIFESFRQAETSDTRNFGGAGLGLSISKGLVELLGGTIWLESIQEIGSTFYFTIPFIVKEIKGENSIEQNVED